MKFYSLGVCLLISCVCFAQNTTVHFVKNSGEYVVSKDSADYIQIVKEPAKGNTLYTVSDFYTDGKVKMEGTSTTPEPVRLEGRCIYYYQNGKRQRIVQYAKHHKIGEEYIYYSSGKLYEVKTYSNADSLGADKKPVPQFILIQACNDSTGKSLVENGVGHYIGYDDKFKYVFEQGEVKDGKREGEWTGYDEGTKLKFTEKYVGGKLTYGISVDPMGKQVGYSERTVAAQYRGGMDAFYKFLSRTIVYPDFDRANNGQGTVIFSFVIDKEGKMKDIMVLRSVSNTIDIEALRVLKLSESNWSRCIYLGVPINQSYTVPISFTLSD